MEQSAEGILADQGDKPHPETNTMHRMEEMAAAQMAVKAVIPETAVITIGALAAAVAVKVETVLDPAAMAAMAAAAAALEATVVTEDSAVAAAVAVVVAVALRALAAMAAMAM